MTYAALLGLDGQAEYRWELDAGGKKCVDARTLHGQVRALEDWLSTALYPGVPYLACGGGKNCDCQLIPEVLPAELVSEDPEAAALLDEDVVEGQRAENEADVVRDGGAGMLPKVDAASGVLESAEREPRARTPAAVAPSGGTHPATGGVGSQDVSDQTRPRPL